MQPFMLVGMPRTGSTLLLTCIQQHPNVTAYGELFHPVFAERSGRHAIICDGQKIFFAGHDQSAVEFLFREVFSEKSKETFAVGFKLFAEYMTSGTANLFGILKKISDIKIIHIVRSNYLNVLASRAVAHATGKWQEAVNEERCSPLRSRVYVDVTSAAAFFDRMKRADGFFSNIVEDTKYFRVEYDKLSCDVHGQVNLVFEFLGVSAFSPTPQLRKQSHLPLYDILTNYAELGEYFRGSEYETFFQRDREGLAYRRDWDPSCRSVSIPRDALVPSMALPWEALAEK
jgi:LPS sulfotransferase NodH